MTMVSFDRQIHCIELRKVYSVHSVCVCECVWAAVSLTGSLVHLTYCV